MRILHVIPSMAHSSGGPAFALRSFCEATPDQHYITILTTTDGGEDSVTLGLKSNLDVVKFHFSGTHSFKYSFELFHWFWVHFRSFDVVHVHAAFSVISDVCAIITLLFGRDLIYRPLGTLGEWSLNNGNRFVKKIWLRLFILPILKRAYAVHCTSEGEAKEVKRLSPNAKVVIVPIPFFGAFSSFPKKRGAKLTFGFLSRLDPKKNVETLISAFLKAEFQQPAKLIIAGDGDSDYKKQLIDSAVSSVGKEIVFAGFITGDRKEVFFEEIDFFVFPSHHENFGLVVLESMAHGIPVVISNQVFLDLPYEMAGIHRTGTDVNSLVEVLQGVSTWTDKDYKKASQSVLETAKSNFSPAAISSELVALYA